LPLNYASFLEQGKCPYLFNFLLCRPPLEHLAPIPKPNYRRKPIFTLVDPNFPPLDELFENVDGPLAQQEDEEMKEQIKKKKTENMYVKTQISHSGVRMLK
jgi:hypothetical protein